MLCGCSIVSTVPGAIVSTIELSKDVLSVRELLMVEECGFKG
jgi:hypothetical protein